MYNTFKVSPRRRWFWEHIFTDDRVINKICEALPDELGEEDDEEIDRVFDMLGKAVWIKANLDLLLQGKARITGFEDGLPTFEAVYF